MSKFIPLLLIPIIWISCDSVDDDFSFDHNLEITFSSDTVSFDTLLTDTRSATRRLTVYNENNASILVSNISLGKAERSDYSIIISGQEGTSQPNERILPGDSLLILVEVNIGPRNQNLPYLVKDSVIFDWNGNTAHVKLVSWGQDGNRVQNQALCDVTWTNERPYVVSDTVLIQPNCTLTIEAGASVFFENDAVMFIQGSLKAIGDSANHIIFRNARFDGVYDQVPGQWNGIYFLEGSSNNEVAFAEIFNAQVGLRVGTPDEDKVPDLLVNNTAIYNMSQAGILGFTSDIEATNCLIFNCGTFLVGNLAGGNYTYRHCTFSSEPSFFVNEDPSVQFSDNIVISDTELLTADLNVELTNNIIWGNSDEELLINNGGGANVTANLTTNIIKSGVEIDNNFTSQAFNFPGFKGLFSFDFSLDTLAFAKDIGTSIGVAHDFLDAPRDQMPDIGAFECIERE